MPNPDGNRDLGYVWLVSLKLNQLTAVGRMFRSTGFLLNQTKY